MQRGSIAYTNGTKWSDRTGKNVINKKNIRNWISNDDLHSDFIWLRPKERIFDIAFDGSNRIKPSMNEHKSPRSRHNLVSYRRYSCQESTKKLCIPGGSEQIIIWTMKPNKSVYNSLYPVHITVYIYYFHLSRRQLLRKSRPCVMPRLCILCKLQTWHKNPHETVF